MFKIGTTDITKLYIGSTEAIKAYLGTTIVYEKSGPTPVYEDIFNAVLTSNTGATYSAHADSANSQIKLNNDGGKYKFGVNSNYIKMSLLSGYTFNEGDILTMTYSKMPEQGLLAVYEYNDTGHTTPICSTDYTNNTLTFTSGVNNLSTLYIRRTSSNNFNGWVLSVNVKRIVTAVKYTVLYDNNGGSGTMIDTGSPYEAGVEVTLMENTFTPPTGKIFSSWLVTDSEGTVIPVSGGKFTMPASNVTVTAQWEEEIVRYDVTYNNGGGTGTMVDTSSPYAAGVEVTLLANTFTPPTGKVFDSWVVTDATGGTITISGNKFTMPASNVTVTAQWIEQGETVIYATKCVASPSGATVTSGNGSITTTMPSWAAGSGEDSAFFTASSNGYYTLTFDTPISLSGYTDVKLTINWGAHNGRGLSVAINGGKLTELVSSSSMTRDVVISTSNTSLLSGISSLTSVKIQASGGASTYYFSIKISGTPV